MVNQRQFSAGKAAWAAVLAAAGLASLFAAVPARSQGMSDPVAQSLTADNVYVDPQLRTVDKPALEQAAAQGNDHPHTTVRIAALRGLPTWANGDRYHYAQQLHDALGMGNAPLVLLVFHEPGRGFTVVAPLMQPSTVRSLEEQAVATVKADPKHPTPALAALAEQVATGTNIRDYTGSGSVVLWVVFFAVVALVAGLLISASRKKRQELAAMRGPIDTLRQNVLSGIEYLDGYIDVLPHNNPDSDQVRLFRQAASTKFDQAAKILDRATEMSDLSRGQGLLDRAQADIAQARRYLDSATGGTKAIPGDDALRPQPLAAISGHPVPPIPDAQPAVDSIPQSQRGVSFFSSRPAPLGALVPVTVTVNGETRQVMATPDEADQMRQGQMPQVRSFQVGGQYVPWYQYQGYDPYRDYWRYQGSGWGGLGSGLVAGFVGAELLGDLFAPRYGGGYGYGYGGGFGYSPFAMPMDNVYYGGYMDAAGQNSWDPGGGWTNGGFGNNDWGANANASGGWDAATVGDVSGADLGSDTNFDTGNFAGSDFSDNSGGSDFGGGDFGGGGDSGGGGGDW